MKETAGPARWTYEDYLGFPEDGNRYQIIRGEKFVTPAPVPRHQQALLNLAQIIPAYVKKAGLGRCWISPIDVVLADDSIVQPDLLFICKERAAIVGEKAILGAPDFVIEILSNSTRKIDRIAKRSLYAAHGVREYWLVDPDLPKVEVFVLEGDELVKKADVTAGEVASLAVLPGLAIPLAEIFQ